MAATYISIGQVKRDISELVNRVAYRGEHVILTSRGKPKAALVSMEEYERLSSRQADDREARWQSWMAASDELAADILKRRRGAPIDVDKLLEKDREDLEARDARADRGD